MAGSSKKSTIKDRLKRNRATGGQPTRTVDVWLGADVDLIEQYAEAVAALEKASDEKPKRFDGTSAKTAAAGRVEALRAQLEEFRVPFRLRGLGDKRWERLVAQHPPRKLEDGSADPDDRAGWDARTFPGALVKAATISPEMDAEDWHDLLGDDETEGQLTWGQIDELATAAYRLSKSTVDVPFWSAASPTTQASSSE